MSGAILDTVKAVVVDRMMVYLKYIKSYHGNMDKLVNELKNLCATKQDIDAKVMEGKNKLEVMTRETTNWLGSLEELIARDEMKSLMKEDTLVAEIAVKMMKQGLMKKLLREDRETFDIVVNVVKKKFNQGSGDAVEDDDYKKVAEIASKVMKDIAEKFKKLMKEDVAAVAAIKLLNDVDLEKLRKDDVEMDKVLRKAEDINRKEYEHNDHVEEELPLMKHDKDVQPVHNNFVKAMGSLREHMGSLMGFLDNDNFKKDLPDGAKLGLEVMDTLIKSVGAEPIEGNAKQHSYCGCCVVRFNDYRRRHDMSQRAEAMIKDVEEMISKCPRDAVTRSKRPDELENISGEFMEGLESREELIRKIVEALKDDKVNVVGVYGMGGVGKTTLAKEVADKRASNLFDKIVMVGVSESPNIKGIQDQIAEGIGLTFDNVSTVAQRARKLYNGLKSEKKEKSEQKEASEKKEKILIVLDNIWKKLRLDEVGIPRERTNNFCCKVLITTREKQVCKDMDVEDACIFEVGLMNAKEALNIFEVKSGKKVDIGEYKPFGDRLLRKCGGLPLTIVATASALRGQDISIWRQYAEESEKPISCQVRTEYSETYSILETSYKLMQIDEKRMFFFLACLSPLDSAVSVGDLMRYGIGLDLFQLVNNLSEAIEQSSRWANELVSSLLLLKGDSDGQVKIHDVVRASAISFAGKGMDRMMLVETIPRWMSKETFRKVTTISLLSGHDFSRLSGVEAPLLEILLLKGDISSSTTLTSNFFQGMTNMKVLSLSNMNFKPGLPESMGGLERLKTLHLHYCKLRDIKLIGKLVMNLLVLSLRGSTLEELLSNEVGELCNLRLLDMGGCKGETSIPVNVLSRLTCLEGLYLFNSFEDWASENKEINDKASVTELYKLPHLNVLEMEVPNLEHIRTLNNDQWAEKVSHFRIQVGKQVRKRIGVSGLPFHRVLELNGTDVSDNQCLRTLLKKTECLRVDGCEALPENLVPQFEEDGFQELKHLDVIFCKNVKFIISSNKQNESMAFGNLDTLRLYELDNLEKICDGQTPSGIFSNLRCLTLSTLPKLKYGLPLTLAPPNLVEVSVTKCRALKFIFIMQNEAETRVTEETYTIVFRVLKSLKIDEVESLSSVCGVAETIDDGLAETSDDGVAETNDDGWQGNQPFFKPKVIFPSLDSFELRFHHTVVALWSKETRDSSVQNLKTLDIYRCKELKSLGSPTIFAALVHLEKLSIKYCDKLQEVIAKETEGNKLREQVIVFPNLKDLTVSDTPILESFYGGSYKLQFPILKSLDLSDAPRLISFIASENSTALFSDKIEFPCLEKLKVFFGPNLSDKVVRLWNWSSEVHRESEGSGNISFNPVPNLQNLTISMTRGMASIPPFVSRNLSRLKIEKFDGIKALRSTSSANGEVLWTYSQLPKLEELSFHNCSTLEDLFENEDDVEAISCLCGQLTKLVLHDIPELKMIPLHLLKNLHSLHLYNINWKYMFEADLFISGREKLQLLEDLNISSCGNMEKIVNDQQVVDGKDRSYVFPRLKSLTLCSLKITNLASNPSTALHFPSLETVYLSSCNEIQPFVSGPLRVPKLKQVTLHECNKLQYFVSENMNEVQELASLESVDISDCEKLLSFSSNPLAAPKLREVEINECPKLKWFLRGGANEDDILELPSLENVSISQCYSMQSFSGGGGIKAPKLRELQIDSKDYSKRGNEELEINHKVFRLLK